MEHSGKTEISSFLFALLLANDVRSPAHVEPLGGSELASPSSWG